MSKILANLTVRQRITIVVVAIAVCAGLYSLVQWRKEGDFRPLFTGLSPEDAAGIVQKLKESGAYRNRYHHDGDALPYGEVRQNLAHELDEAMGLPESRSADRAGNVSPTPAFS